MIRRYLTIMLLLAASITAYGATKLTTIDNSPKQSIADERPTGDMSEAHHIIISKENMRLRLYDRDSLLICSFPVSMGKHYGDKQELGDMKTPEGDFSIVQIQSASHWMYNTSKESVKGYYGNWFIRLNTKYSGIGIHGTHLPESIGERDTEGSIRLNNYHLDSLRAMIDVGMAVRIESSRRDREADGKSAEPEIAVAEEFIPIVDDKATPIIEEQHTESVESVESVEKVAEPKEVVTKPAQKTTTESSEEVWHTIKDGELVGRIAANYGVSIAEIKRLNPGINVDRVSIGQRIKVKGEVSINTPAEPKKEVTATSDSGEVWHTVADGDLVGRIATKYGTSVKRIKELNPDLNPDRISIGQKIRVK
ncbi:MAG: LysM peptidoglycan-binding domain-containing protein [Alistipes sp.]|nr:LysM peptidoglycan-binding domain-containing protein [Alistipes sp.]